MPVCVCALWHFGHVVLVGLVRVVAGHGGKGERQMSTVGGAVLKEG